MLAELGSKVETTRLLFRAWVIKALLKQLSQAIVECLLSSKKDW